MAAAFFAGMTTVLSSVASVAVLPSVVRSDQIVEANAKLSVAGSVVSLAGPGLAGGLIQILSAPKAILFDAASNVASALSLRKVGASAGLAGERSSLVRDIKEGLRELIATPLLRALTISSAVFAVGLAMNSTILMLYLTRELGLTPATIGICLAAGGAGTLLGSTVAKRISGRIGMGPAIIGGTLVEAIAAIAIPLSALLANPIPALIAGQLLNGFGISVYSINHVSLRQQTVGTEFLGRITAGRRFLTFSIAPAGAALGGWIGEVFGLTAAMSASALMLFAGTLVMWASPVRRA
jgi:Na+/melibiose symporter-like transporter